MGTRRFDKEVHRIFAAQLLERRMQSRDRLVEADRNAKRLDPSGS